LFASSFSVNSVRKRTKRKVNISNREGKERGKRKEYEKKVERGPWRREPANSHAHVAKRGDWAKEGLTLKIDVEREAKELNHGRFWRLRRTSRGDQDEPSTGTCKGKDNTVSWGAVNNPGNTTYSGS